MKKSIVVLVLFAVGLSLFAQDLPFYGMYESSNEVREFDFGYGGEVVRDVIKYDRTTIDTAMSRLLDNMRKAKKDRSRALDAHGYYFIAEVPNTRPTALGANYFDTAIPYFVEKLDGQGGKQYTLYYWPATPIAGQKDENYDVVFYYYKENGRIRYKYRVEKYITGDVWGNAVCTTENGVVTAIGSIGNGSYIPNNVIRIARDAFRGKNIPSVTIPSSVINIDKGAFANSEITSITVSSLLRNACREAFTGNPVKSITITAQQIVWPERQGPRGGAEPQTVFKDYLDEFFYKNSAPGTYTWDGTNWSFEKTEIPGDFFGKDSKRSPGLYTWEDGGWSYQSGSQYIADYDYYFGDYGDGRLYGSLPEPGVYKWENNTWVYHKHGE